MPHSKHIMPSPHPKNPERTQTLVFNNDCPRCGAAALVELEPDDLLHCPACKGAINACGRIEDGDEDRTANIVVIAWVQPARFSIAPCLGCDCAGCKSTRAQKGS